MVSLESMEKIRELIIHEFDITKLGNICNYKGCNKKPAKAIYIYEFTMKKNIGIVTLYLCEKHLNEVDALLRKMRKIEPHCAWEKEIKGEVAQPGRAHG